MLTGEGTINNAVESMRLGVFDFQTKPFPMGELERRCLAAIERRKLEKRMHSFAVIARTEATIVDCGTAPMRGCSR
ncbi:MAG: hypothetical protein R3C56_34110 [Pirellulaceae bacterium]